MLDVLSVAPCDQPTVSKHRRKNQSTNSTTENHSFLTAFTSLKGTNVLAVHITAILW